MKESRLFDLFIMLKFPKSNHNAFYHLFNIIKIPSMSRGAPSWFNNVLIYDGDGKVTKY
jgi:hypothetical protein